MDKRVLLVVVIAIMVFADRGDCEPAVRSKKIYGLDELLSMAYEQNPAMKIIHANVDINKGQATAAAAYPNPVAEFGVGKGNATDTGGSMTEYSASIAQTVEWPSKRKHRNRYYESRISDSDFDINVFHLQLRYEVRRAFYESLLNTRIKDLREQNLKSANDFLATAESRVRTGEAPEFELVKAKVEALRAEKDLSAAKGKAEIGRQNLNRLLGGTIGNDFDIEGDFSGPVKDYGLDELIAKAMESHPSISKYENLRDAGGYLVDFEKSSVIPDVTLRLSYAHELGREAYALSVAVPLPLWNRRNGDIAAAYAQQVKADAEITKVRTDLSAAIKEAHQNYLIARSQREVFRTGLLSQAEEALKIAGFSYKRGETSYIDFLDAQRVYRTTSAEYYQALFELAESLARLEMETGGLP